jgi:hypothetical protein
VQRLKMQSKQVSFADTRSVRKWTALLCLLLAGMACTAQALHSHPDDLAGGAKHCAACQVAHAAARVAPVAHSLVHLTSTALVGLFPSPTIKHGPDSFPLFCRPPPDRH